MEQYKVKGFTYDNDLYTTNLITNYYVKEIYNLETLHIHCSEVDWTINVELRNLEKIKSEVVVYGDCYRMFYYSHFTGDISNWDTSSVKNMKNMFGNCPAKKPKWYK